MKRYPAHRTRLAPASRVTGTVALATAAVAMGVRQLDLIDPQVLFLSLFVAAILAVLAGLMAVWALSRVWRRGGSGAGSALAGGVFALLALAPGCLLIAAAVFRPQPADVSTDPRDPPDLAGASTTDAVVAERIMELVAYGVALKNEFDFGRAEDARPGDAQPYPDIVPRRYRIPPARLHVAAREAASEEGLTIVDELPPDLADAPTWLEAVGTTPILRFTQTVAIRVRPDAVGARLDIRSASSVPLTDLTGNVERIRGLFAAIDRVLTDTYGSLDSVALPEDAEDDIQVIDAPADDKPGVMPVPGFKPYFDSGEGGAEGNDQLPDDLEG